MNVRPATPADIPLVLPMVAKICDYHERLDPAKFGFLPNSAERYRNWLAARSTDRRSVFLVADATSGNETQRLAGFLIGTVEKEIPIYRIDEFGFIHDLWVEEEYRHEGIARQMVTLAVERFAGIGVKQIRLDVSDKNPSARQLFTTCGFRPSIVEMLLEVR